MDPCRTVQEEVQFFLQGRTAWIIRRSEPTGLGMRPCCSAHLTFFPCSVILVTFRTPHFSDGCKRTQTHQYRALGRRKKTEEPKHHPRTRQRPATSAATSCCCLYSSHPTSKTGQSGRRNQIKINRWELRLLRQRCAALTPEIKIFKASNIRISRGFGSSDTILFQKTAEVRSREGEKGVLTEVGGLGDEGQESESGEGGLGPRGASWWGDRWKVQLWPQLEEVMSVEETGGGRRVISGVRRNSGRFPSSLKRLQHFCPEITRAKAQTIGLNHLRKRRRKRGAMVGHAISSGGRRSLGPTSY